MNTEQTTTKDEQIQVQAQTIESLRKTVENLETELQKYLKPESDSGNPPEALRLKKDGLLQQVIYNSLTAALLPVHGEWNERLKERMLAHCSWWYFRAMLFQMNAFDGHWANKDFRNGVDMLNDLAQATETPYPKTLEGFDKFETGYRLFSNGSEKHQQLIRGTKSLLAALQLIEANYLTDKDDPDYQLWYDEEGFHLCFMALKIILSCQELWATAEDSD